MFIFAGNNVILFKVLSLYGLSSYQSAYSKTVFLVCYFLTVAEPINDTEDLLYKHLGSKSVFFQ